MDLVKIVLKTNVIVCSMTGSSILINVMGIWSSPADLDVMLLIAVMTSPSETLRKDKVGTGDLMGDVDRLLKALLLLG